MELAGGLADAGQDAREGGSPGWVAGGAGLRKGIAGFPAARCAKRMVNRHSVLGSQLREETRTALMGNSSEMPGCK